MAQKFDYPLGFLTEINGWKKDEILKEFIDAFFNDEIDVEAIEVPRVKKAYFELLMEADKAATSMSEKLDRIGEAAVRSIHSGNRKNRRKKLKGGKTVKERAREAGLVTLTPNVPKGKLILE